MKSILETIESWIFSRVTLAREAVAAMQEALG